VRINPPARRTDRRRPSRRSRPSAGPEACSSGALSQLNSLITGMTKNFAGPVGLAAAIVGRLQYLQRRSNSSAMEAPNS
jgi:hypothetical protein